MCNLYEATPRDKIRAWAKREIFGPDYAPVIAPLRNGPFMLADRTLVGQWGMIPSESKARRPQNSQGRPLSTNNARREGMAKSWTYGRSWMRGMRCLIPADSYDEPYWGTGKNIWWRFRRADGQPWALAGLWSQWTDPATGEIIPSYTMITQNCDAHPLLSLMHKPDPKLASDAQDKRTVVPIERADWEQWLSGSIADAAELIKVPPTEIFIHGAANPEQQVDLPIKR